MDQIKILDMDFAYAYVQMFDLLDDCIIVVDVNEKIVLINKATENLDKITKEEAIGQSYRDVYRVNVHSSSTLKCLDTGKSVKNMYQDYITKRGDNIITISSSYPLVKNGVTKGVFTVTKDITEYEEMMKIFRRNYNQKDNSDKYAENKTEFTFKDIIGQNKDLLSSINLAKTAARTDANILIYGETGTGKELYAQSIHNESGLRGDFVSINCAAIPKNLLESMLFGTSKGAYTGAINKAGLFEEADQGTLFLDELNSMNIDLQAKILRAVETGRIRRLGENKEREINTRIISSTNIHPFDAIEAGKLRRDLYYRLGVVNIRIPPLRERLDDIPILTEYFIDRFNKKYDKQVKGIDSEVYDIFKKFDWKGNVRELQHNIEQSVIMKEESGYLHLDDLPYFIKEWVDENYNEDEKSLDEVTILESSLREIAMIEESNDLDTILNQTESQIIEQALAKHDFNVSKAAKDLGLSRQTLDYRIGKYNIEKN